MKTKQDTPLASGTRSQTKRYVVQDEVDAAIRMPDLTKEKVLQTNNPTNKKMEHTTRAGKWNFAPPRAEEFVNVKLIRYRHEESKTKKQYLTHIRYAAKQILYLSSFAEAEYWGDKQRILRSYLNATFQRLVEQGKVLVYTTYELGNSEEHVVMVWNTGLITANSALDVYCVMVRNDVFTNKLSGKQSSPEVEDNSIALQWRIATFMSEDKFSDLKTFRFMVNNWSTVEVRMKDIPNQVPLASYFSTNESVPKFFYDPQIPFKKTDINIRHLLHHKEMFSEEIISMDSNHLIDSLNTGIEISLRRARHNYRLAIPQYFRDKNNNGEGVVQLLLPIKLQSGDKELPEIAVALQLESDGNNYYYVVKTLFTMDMAYSNARLLQKVDQSWLLSAVTSPRKKKEKDEKSASAQTVYVPYYVPIYYPNYQAGSYEAENAIPD